MAWSPGWWRISSPCAVTPPTGCPARRASVPRRPPSSCVGSARWRPCWRRRAQTAAGEPGGAEGGMRPRTAAALCENEELVRTFKQIATLQRIEVERPVDRVTDFAGGARVAREMGMRRLADRLEGLAGPRGPGA